MNYYQGRSHTKNFGFRMFKIKLKESKNCQVDYGHLINVKLLLD